MTAGAGDDDRFLSRREAEVIIANTFRESEARFEAHQREHANEREATKTALDVSIREQTSHNEAHEKAHDAHEAAHSGESLAVKTAVESVVREGAIHKDAHARDHDAHQREHLLVNLAVDKAESAADKRFENVNGLREQMNVLIRTLASKDSFEAHVKDVDRRLEDLRNGITELQKVDVQAAGKGIGQGTAIAAIISAIGVAATILGIIVVVSGSLR